jgi:hypothetical protein
MHCARDGLLLDTPHSLVMSRYMMLRSKTSAANGSVEPGVGYYKLLFRGCHPTRVGRLKKLTCVSQFQLNDGQQPGRRPIDTIDTCGRCNRNSHLDKLDAGDDTAKATDTV